MVKRRLRPRNRPQERTDVAQSSCPSCGAVGTLWYELARHWRMESAAPVGGGWYVQCRSVDDWRAVRARRAWAERV